MFSLRRVAVTVISWIESGLASLAAAAAYTMPVAELPNIAAIAQDNFGFAFMLRYPHLLLNVRSICSTSRPPPSCPKTLPESRLSQKRFLNVIHVLARFIAVISCNTMGPRD